MDFTHKHREAEPLRCSDGCDTDFDNERLLGVNEQQRKRKSKTQRLFHLVTLYTIAVAEALILLGLLWRPTNCQDPTLAIWSPANEVVAYKMHSATPYFFNRSPWLGTDRKNVDTMWANLYDYGTSGISQHEASKLLNATVTAPLADDVHLIELQVIHDLHCLNMLRKVAYPDQYPEMWERYENGTVNHDTTQSLHIDHCIDALRQSLQCTADVTPIKWIHHPDDDYHVFPLTWSTRTCRDFNAIKNWAIERQVPASILDFEHSGTIHVV